MRGNTLYITMLAAVHKPFPFRGQRNGWKRVLRSVWSIECKNKKRKQLQLSVIDVFRGDNVNYMLITRLSVANKGFVDTFFFGLGNGEQWDKESVTELGCIDIQ